MSVMVRAAIALALALVGPGGSAGAQSASCPPGLKLAAGACVRTCPGGYEDRGDVCLYRNQRR